MEGLPRFVALPVHEHLLPYFLSFLFVQRLVFRKVIYSSRLNSNLVSFRTLTKPFTSLTNLAFTFWLLALVANQPRFGLFGLAGRVSL